MKPVDEVKGELVAELAGMVARWRDESRQIGMIIATSAGLVGWMVAGLIAIMWAG